MLALTFLLARFAEPSTHASLAALAQGAKLFAPVQYHPLCDSFSLAFGGAGAVMVERGRAR